MTAPIRLSELLGHDEWLSVRRTLSATPLAKAHARLLDGAKPRVRRAIPWERFRPSAYPAAALALASDQAHKLAEGEYGAVALFGQIASGLAMTRAPFDIVSAAAAIGGDEIRHADYCVQFAELCAGNALELRVAKHEVRNACSDLYDIDGVDFFLLKYSAIGETLAAVLLNACQEGAKDPVARALYRSIAGDEVHHARLGWYYFAWRAPQWSEAEKQRLADSIAEFVIDIERTFWHGRDAAESSRAAAAALGVLDSERQRRVIAEVMNDEIVPALDAIGLGGTQLWSARTRGASALPRAENVLRAFERASPPDEKNAVDAAAAWLAAAIANDGSLRFAFDPRGEAETFGAMHHGRAAVVLAALRAHGGFDAEVRRLEAWLERELDAWQRGELPLAWPCEQAVLVGTLALYTLAGLPLGASLRDAAKTLETAGPDAAWHGAQALSVLGADAELDALWDHCVAELDQHAWAPWTARAAAARGDAPTLARCRKALLATLDASTERATAAPIAMIAASLEALAATSTAVADAGDAELATIARARTDLLHAQCAQNGKTRGAFPISLTDATLRSDVTAHALLALLATDPTC